jgi:hypothetical protein
MAFTANHFHSTGRFDCMKSLDQMRRNAATARPPINRRFTKNG